MYRQSIKEEESYVFICNTSCVRQFRKDNNLITIFGEKHNYVDRVPGESYYDKGYDKDIEYGESLYKKVVEEEIEDMKKFKKGTTYYNIACNRLSGLGEIGSSNIMNYIKDKITGKRADTRVYLEYSQTNVPEKVSSFNIQLLTRNEFFISTAEYITIDNRINVIDLQLYSKKFLDNIEKYDKNTIIGSYIANPWECIVSGKCSEYFNLGKFDYYFPKTSEKILEQLKEIIYQMENWDSYNKENRKKIIINYLRPFWNQFYDLNMLSDIFENINSSNSRDFREYISIIGYGHIENLSKLLRNEGYEENNKLRSIECRDNNDYIFTKNLWVIE